MVVWVKFTSYFPVIYKWTDILPNNNDDLLNSAKISSTESPGHICHAMNYSKATNKPSTNVTQKDSFTADMSTSLIQLIVGRLANTPFNKQNYMTTSISF